MTETVAVLGVDIVGNSKPLANELSKSEGMLRASGNRLSGIGSQIGSGIAQGLGISMGLGIAGVSAQVVGLGVDVIQLGVSWESAFAGVEKTVDGTTSQLAALESQLLGLSMSDSPVAGLENAAIQLAGIAEMAGQLGVAREDIVAFTETIGLLQMTTNLAGEEGAAMLAQFANITQMDMSNIDRLGAAIVALGNSGASTETQIVEFAHRLAGAGAQAGMTEAEILALGSAMASAGLNAEAGGTAMTTVLNKMATAAAKGGTALETFARVSNISAEQFADTWRNEPTKALALFLDGLNDLDQATQLDILEQLELDGIRVSDTLRRLSGNVALVESSLDTANTAWDENNALMTEAEKRAQTTAAQWEMLKNKLKGFGTLLSSEILPVLNMSLSGLNMLAEDIGGVFGIDFGLDTSELDSEVAALPGQIKDAVLGGFTGDPITVEQGITVTIPAGSSPWAVWESEFSDQFTWEDFRTAAVNAASAAGFPDVRSIPAGFQFTINAQGDLMLVGGETGGVEGAMSGMTTQLSGLTAAAEELLGGAFGQLSITADGASGSFQNVTTWVQQSNAALAEANVAATDWEATTNRNLSPAALFANTLAYIAEHAYGVYSAFGEAVWAVDEFANNTRDTGEGLINQLGIINQNASQIPGLLSNIVTEAGNMTLGAGLALYDTTTDSIESSINEVLNKLPGISDVQISLPDGLTILSSALGGISSTIGGIISGLETISGSGGGGGGLIFEEIDFPIPGNTPTPTGRASGGHITAGQMYLVGEEGPELFTSSTSGQIIPNHDLAGMSNGASGGGGGMALTINNLTVNGVQDAEGLLDELVSIASTRANPGFVMEGR